jgi:hypothetical protein
MNVEQMREAIMYVYSSESWKRKVSNMPDDQVIAIYFDFNRKGYLEKPPRDSGRKFETKTNDISKNKAVQISIYDLLRRR